MTHQSKMVMPPIYRFYIPDYPRESTWGWHRATEVVEAVNNILELKGKQCLSPEDMNKAYPFVVLEDEIDDQGKYTPVIRDGCSYGGTSVGPVHWLATLVRHDMYLPAKVGMSLINAAKRNATYNAIRRATQVVVGAIKN